ncbi:hypothetical protein FKM82_015029 [Ascaphus truei]
MRNTRILAEALTRVIYNMTEKGAPSDLQIFTEQMRIQREQLDAVMHWLTSQPRAAQLVDKDSPVLSTLEYYMSRYLKDIKLHHFKADKRDPEFLFYDQLKQTMNAYRVKPAIFDLLLALCIAAYLGVSYIAVQNFGLLYKLVQRVSWKPKQAMPKYCRTFSSSESDRDSDTETVKFLHQSAPWLTIRGCNTALWGEKEHEGQSSTSGTRSAQTEESMYQVQHYPAPAVPTNSLA